MNDEPISVLLAEDTPADALLTSRALKLSNLNVSIHVVQDGVEALDFIFATGKYSERDRNDLPRLIILDLKMPRMSGLVVLQRIRMVPTTQNIPVIIFSSSSQDEDIEESYKQGANDYVIKPIDLTQYTDAIQRAAEKWL